MLGAGDRMGRHEMNGLRQMRAHVAHDRALDRTDIGNDRAGFEMRADLLGDRAANADRNADDDEIGAVDGLGVGLRHRVGEAELDDALSRLRRMRGCHDRAHGALARAARAIDEPISPTPMMASVSNRGLVISGPRRWRP